MAWLNRLVPAILPVGVLLVSALPASAQVSVRAPGVAVDVGPGVAVRAPFVRVVVPPQAPPVGLPYVPPPPSVPPIVIPGDPGVPPVPPQEGQFAPQPPVLPTPIPVPGPSVPGVLVRPVTPEEFADNFKPHKPGAYEVIFLHPHTRLPVKVCFELPVCPKRVRACKDRVDFRWGLLKGVSLIFEKNGTVRIKKC